MAVISFGHKANSWVPAHLAQIGMVTSAADEIWDLRTMMSDPLAQDRVTNGEDGRHDRTQIAVFGQESFIPAIGQMTDSLLEAYMSNKDATLMSITGCVTGAHRADTLGKAECDMLNACTHSDGTKVFHAMHFTMTRCNSKRECEHAINQAWKWAEEGAWCDVPTCRSRTCTARSLAVSAPSRPPTGLSTVSSPSVSRNGSARRREVL